MRRIVLGLGALFVVVLLPSTAHAQVNSSEATVALTATLPESLSVSLLPTSVSFSLTAGSATNPGGASVAATTTWTLNADRTSLKLFGYFSTAAAALVHTASSNTVDIPSSLVEVSVNGGANAAFDQTTVFGDALGARQLFSQAITPATASGSRTDTVALNINLSTLSLPADTYTGTLRIRAQVTP